MAVLAGLRMVDAHVLLGAGHHLSLGVHDWEKVVAGKRSAA